MFRALGKATRTTFRKLFTGRRATAVFSFLDDQETLWVVVEVPSIHLGEELARAHKLGTEDWGDFPIDTEIIVYEEDAS